ncbi:MAG TPA: hypothetical protein VIQ11_10665, partial [Mycobacterium sp.]
LAHTEDQAALMRTAFRTPETELLVCAMEDEQRTIPELVDQLERASSAVEAAVAAGSLAVVCTARIEQESDYLLPALEEDGVDLTRLLADRPRIGGRQAPVARPEGAEGRSRSVDVRGLDYYNRRHHIFTAVDGLAPGRELQLISDRLNDVTWLRYEMEARSPRRYFWSQPQELEAGMVRTTVRCPDKITG